MWERRAPAWGQNKSAALPASASLPVMLPCDQTFNTVWQSYLQEHTLNSTTTAILLWGRWYDVWSECTCYCQEAHVRSRSSVSNTYIGGDRMRCEALGRFLLRSIQREIWQGAILLRIVTTTFVSNTDRLWHKLHLTYISAKTADRHYSASLPSSLTLLKTDESVYPTGI